NYRFQSKNQKLTINILKMKKILLMVLLCFISMESLAQKIKVDFNETNDYEPISALVKDKIEDYAFEIRKIVIDEKILMNEEISNLDEQVKNNLISESDAEGRKKEISQKYSGKINERIEALDFDLDEIIKKQVEYTILNTDVEKLA